MSLPANLNLDLGDLPHRLLRRGGTELKTQAEGTVIPYNPDHGAQAKLRGWMRRERLASFIFGAVLVVGTLIWGAGTTVPILAWAAIFLLIMVIRAHDHPFQIVVNDQGIGLRWRYFGNSALFRWDQISMVAGEGGGRFTIRLLPDTMSISRRICARLAYSDFMTGWKPLKVTLDLGGIENGADRRRLYQSIARFLPAEKLDPNLADFVSPLDPGSYTTLWLDSLACAPDRIAYEPLSQGILLGNGRYSIIAPIGSGGQGTVYKALSLRQNVEGEPDTVVLKEFVLPVQGGKEATTQSLAHVEQEAALLKRLDDPRILKLFDTFVEDHRAYLVLQFIEGPSLRDLVIESGKLDEPRVKQIGLQMCEILSYLHAQTPPVIHRDFTPENLMLGSDEMLRLIDFNVAQQLDSTTTRTIAGKHAFIPPEQFRGTATVQSDIYAAGATLFYLLTGQEPEPISVSHPKTVDESVSKEMDETVARATALDAALRYSDSSALKAELLGRDMAD